MTCSRRMWLKCILICDSIEVTTIFSLLSTCWVSTHGPCRLKSGNDVAIAEIIRDDGGCLKNFQTDRGKEFFYSDVQKLLKRNITHYSTYFVMKAPVIERFNRTLKNDIWKQFTHVGNYGSTSCSILYQITTRASIELLVCVPMPCNRRINS